jgi:predicted nucleic acid-binding protein
MILADTCVVIAVQRDLTNQRLRIIHEQEPAVCGITCAEVLAGARTDRDVLRIQSLLSVFRRVGTPESIWQILGANQSALMARGITVPFTDALIATVAIENDLELWTYDSHFSMMQSVLPRLRLFVEPPQP